MCSESGRYAAAPQELRTDWVKFTKDYFLNRSTLVSVFLLIDASIPAKKIDLEYASWLGQNQVRSSYIYNRMKRKYGVIPWLHFTNISNLNAFHYLSSPRQKVHGSLLVLPLNYIAESLNML